MVKEGERGRERERERGKKLITFLIIDSERNGGEIKSYLSRNMIIT